MQCPHLLPPCAISGISPPFTATQTFWCHCSLWTSNQQRGFYSEQKSSRLQGFCSLVFTCFQPPPQHRSRALPCRAQSHAEDVPICDPLSDLLAGGQRGA